MPHQLLGHERMEEFAAYADRHGIFNLLESIVARMLVEKPEDVMQFMMDALQKPKMVRNGWRVACASVARQLDVPHIWTGQLLRQAIEKQSSLGIQAKPFMERGQLVPDQIILGLVSARLQDPEIVQKGFVLEGFPRTREQGMAILRKGLLIDHIVCFEVPDDAIVQYATNLRYDPVTNRTYHLTMDPPKAATVLSRLLQRPADTEVSVRRRLATYRRNQLGVSYCFPGRMRRLTYPEVISGREEGVLHDVLAYLGTGPVTRAPRMFKVVVAGPPGSGKSRVAELIERKYGFVHVSPRIVLLEEVSAKSPIGIEYGSCVNDTSSVPEEVILNLICRRLNAPDCVGKGWILDDFPNTREQALALQEKGFVPNRERRYNPTTGERVNLAALPPSVSKSEAASWPIRPEDAADLVSERIARSRGSRQELELAYGFRRPPGTTTLTHRNSSPGIKPGVASTGAGGPLEGIMQDIDADGLGEGSGGKGSPLDTVFEKVEGALLRPVPIMVTI
ncbi:adenylate kinase-domain-containing protein [Blyttiomyces helicus]|uniref:Adenylate kinase-domain-containing protein n=1 Tax=Blyttiomyces helicus TaxID=388810 RepID=A0A4P9WIV2_9FUNG|nr:adenylate kinase-domain-containing protein [Blyttiomyces helicus]|eukprot:RKO92734.1 adenylate kinase-domain-containing protein [Blyttiomyces helicus]